MCHRRPLRVGPLPTAARETMSSRRRRVGWPSVATPREPFVMSAPQHPQVETLVHSAGPRAPRAAIEISFNSSCPATRPRTRSSRSWAPTRRECAMRIPSPRSEARRGTWSTRWEHRRCRRQLHHRAGAFMDGHAGRGGGAVHRQAGAKTTGAYKPQFPQWSACHRPQSEATVPSDNPYFWGYAGWRCSQTMAPWN